MKNANIPKTIPDIIDVINKSNDVETIITMENYMACYYAGPILFASTIINYYINYILMSYNLNKVIMESIFLLFLSFCFVITPYLKFKTKFITHWVSILFSIVLVYVTLRFYSVVGSFILMIAFLEIIIASARITKVMLNYITITTFLVGGYIFFLSSKNAHELTPIYYVLLVILFILMFLIVPAMYMVSKSHYQRITRLYLTEVHQREELEKMYNETRSQYNLLTQKNNQLKINEERLYRLAHFDELTYLPNRKSILDKLNYLIKVSKGMNLSFYIIFIDIDSFKKINDSMGHHIGDLFISDAAKRLKASIHKSDFIGRIGGDEFALIIQRRLSNKEVFKYIDKIRKHFLQPFIIEGNEITSSASFGIASFPYDGVGQVELMKNADTAMYKAKELGKNNVQFFENSMKEELLEKLNLENELKSALYNNEFFLVFQPIYNLRTGKIRGFETLVRWNSPVLGMVAPDKFIPVTEELGIIIPLGEWIIRTACKTFKKLQDKYKLEEAVLAINLSVKQLESPNIVESIKYILKETNFDPNLLEIEITETTFMNSIHKTKSTLEKLQDMHISISLDDFGTGYSSLSYLRQLPIDILKIDRTFINDILKSDRNVEIIGSIIDLSHNLDIAVIAEGIEEEIQLRHLRKLKCDYVQGYLMSKPLNLEDLEQFILQEI
ncbi:putative bifunctional diguanylate cyclase/phosphodiesterase [Clostridium intestinale]|uniref:EAL domain-containing protein n=1 Tax=Clostridium intestinale TaxID=36845 RepID=A0A7D6VTL2_9CLOT|nr:GGDEF domain-containing phosphodiesterase [Clostridium intestinale]QLY82166.1 EAL domain-containing protein [Clostridium intestinale]